MTTKYTLFSLGYRCSSAGILKHLGVKHESHPFDWIVSRLPVVRHCLETDYRYFLGDISANYQTLSTTTSHYDVADPANNLFICDERVHYNRYYSSPTLFPLSPIHTSKPLSMPKDTYAFPLLLNHHDIFLPKDADYFRRCVGRLDALLRREHTPDHPPTMYLYIHPALSVASGEYAENADQLLAEILDFQRFLQQKYPLSFPRGLVFLPLKTAHPYPITDHCDQVVKEIYNGLSHALDGGDRGRPQCVIYEVYMNKDFVDAGEIFMRNAYIETEKMMECVRQYAL